VCVCCCFQFVSSEEGESNETFEAVALYPYHGKQDDQLSFGKNDVITVQQKQDPWWFGEFNGKVVKRFVHIFQIVNFCKIFDTYKSCYPVKTFESMNES